MSRNSRHEKGWFQERDEARARQGTARQGTMPATNGQQEESESVPNPQEPGAQTMDNREIGQYSGQGVPANMKK